MIWSLVFVYQQKNIEKSMCSFPCRESGAAKSCFAGVAKVFVQQCQFMNFKNKK